MSVICFAVIELIAFILYLIDRDLRKTILRVAIFSILTAGSGIIYFLFVFFLILFLLMMIARLLCSIFKKTEHKTAVVNMNRKIIGWLKREIISIIIKTSL